MEYDINARLDAIEAKVDATYKSAEKMRKYFLITMWVTLATIVLPAVGLVLVLPSFISYYTGSLTGF